MTLAAGWQTGVCMPRPVQTGKVRDQSVYVFLFVVFYVLPLFIGPV